MALAGSNLWALKEGPKIVVSKGGPYIVYGVVPLSLQTIVPNEEGISWDWKEGRSFVTDSEYRLCRCGLSKGQPFCDDVCKRITFDGKETARRDLYEDETKTYEGPTLTLKDAEPFCAHARFCMAAGKVWNLVKQSGEPAARELAIREVDHCPSGRLALEYAKTHASTEQVVGPSIAVVEDPAKGCSGPLWVKGGIRIESEDGTPYAKRDRATLCRCGASPNKPFCNGTHKRIKFQDGLVPLSSNH